MKIYTPSSFSGLTAFFVVVMSFFVFSDAQAAFSTVDCTNAGHRTTIGGGTEMPQAQCEALGEIWSDTNGASWTVNTGWDTLTDANTWTGVTLVAGRVTQLRLNGNNLSGPIPPELVDLSDAIYFRLYDNHLTGSIPPELGNMPALLHLMLQDNDLTGAIPPEIGDITTLTRLELFGNDLTGSIPSELGNLSNLEWLNLQLNDLSGSIPSELGNLSNLDTLKLFGNDLTGSIPSNLVNMSSIIGLNLYDNQLSGDIPDFSGIGSLLYFRIYGNEFLFEDFEDEFVAYAGLTTFQYSPQAQVEKADQFIDRTEGEDFTLTITVDENPSGNDSYQWYKDGSPIGGATERTYTKTGSSVADSGVYTYAVTNSVVTGLTLGSYDFTVTVSALPESEEGSEEVGGEETEDGDTSKSCEKKYGSDSYKSDYQKVKYHKNHNYDLYIAMQNIYRTYRVSGDVIRKELERENPEVYDKYKEYRRYKKYKDCKK
jgi:hypothetical protein